MRTNSEKKSVHNNFFLCVCTYHIKCHRMNNGENGNNIWNVSQSRRGKKKEIPTDNDRWNELRGSNKRTKLCIWNMNLMAVMQSTDYSPFHSRKIPISIGRAANEREKKTERNNEHQTVNVNDDGTVLNVITISNKFFYIFQHWVRMSDIMWHRLSQITRFVASLFLCLSCRFALALLKERYPVKWNIKWIWIFFRIRLECALFTLWFFDLFANLNRLDKWDENVFKLSKKKMSTILKLNSSSKYLMKQIQYTR